jgi:hypothetical protein
MRIRSLPAAAALAALASAAATAQPLMIVEAQPRSQVLVTEQSRDGVATGRPTLVEVRPGVALVDRSRVNDAQPGEVVVLRNAVPVPHPMRVGAANTGTNPSGTELAGQNSGQ